MIRRWTGTALLVACSGPDSDSGNPDPTVIVGLESRPTNSNCLAMGRPSTKFDLSLQPIFEHLTLSQPVSLEQTPSGIWILAEQGGRVLAFAGEDDVDSQSIALDLQDVVNPGFETGLLGLALHPEFDVNGQIILSYTLLIDGEVYSRLSRFHSADGGWLIDPRSEEVLLELEQPYSNHNGGQVAFGADGFLYASFGDGGSAGDPLGHGQNPFSLYGSIIRIDIDAKPPYGIPSGNPFANGERGAPEVYAYGFRNVWRFTFDSDTNTLWAGDVGQYNAEEIDRVELGGNYGWNIVEGNECYGSPDCDTAGLISPVWTYPNTSGASVVMGPVYRGHDMPELVGTPLFTDFYDGIIRAIRFDPTTGEAQEEHLAETNRYISSFGTDNTGEIYALDYYGGSILRLESGADTNPPTIDEVPSLLSSTGCMDDSDPRLPGPAMIPYGVQHSFWSDGAAKSRWLALPDDKHIQINTDGDWTLPIGSVLIKHFYLQETLVETRLMMRHDDGEWGGYSYAWREDGSDADLLNSDALKDFGEATWSYPSRADCLKCHTTAAGGSLGLETAQLNGLFDYETAQANQLETFKQIGIIWYDQDTSSLPSLQARSSDAGSARSLLHVNCSGCHRPDGPGGGDLDLRWDTPLQDTGACNVDPQHGELGLTNSALIKPGEPELSILSHRMHRLDHARMPPLGTTQIDTEGVAAVDAWIRQIQQCTE